MPAWFQIIPNQETENDDLAHMYVYIREMGSEERGQYTEMD